MNRKYTHTSINPYRRAGEILLFILLIVPMFLLAHLALWLAGDEYEHMSKGDGM